MTPSLVRTFDIEAAATLWALGRNMREIAERLGVPEYVVWNALTEIKASTRH